MRAHSRAATASEQLGVRKPNPMCAGVSCKLPNSPVRIDMGCYVWRSSDYHAGIKAFEAVGATYSFTGKCICV